jgi:hypothetical protein
MMNEYYSTHTPAQSKIMKEVDKTTEIGIDNWGTTTNPFEHQTQALKARIFHGANRVEFAFFGGGKGRKENPTPETFGQRERMDMRELAEFNEVETTTHATVAVSGLSGLEMQQGMFDDRHRKEAIDEIKRAIHFAAEATTGGAVVFHTGEAPRSMRTHFMDEKGNPVFELYPEEGERELFYLADPVTKRLNPIKRNDRIGIPIMQTVNGKVQYLTDENGNPIIDSAIKEHDPLHEGKTPVYDLEEDGSVKVRIMSFNDWVKHREEEYRLAGKEPPKDTKEYVKDFFRVQALNQVQYNMNFYRLHKGQFQDMMDSKKKIEQALVFYRDLKKKIPEDEWWKVQQQAAPRYFVPPDVLDPIKHLETQLADLDRNIIRAQQMDALGKRQALETLEMVDRSIDASEFAVQETSKSMAELGVYAWQMTEKTKREGQGGEDEKGNKMLKLKNDIYLAPENVFPEAYGSHPDELKNIILKGREEMVKELTKRYKVSEDKAKELAKNHIKATFDIGHANIWRKYFISKEGESLEARDKRFNEWLLKETKKLVKEGIIGHIHVSDNFGFHDEHLSAGDGNAPIKEFIQMAKAEGLNEFIVESGSFNPLTSLPDTWMHFDSPVYNLHVPGFKLDPWTEPSIGATSHGWNNFYRSYFGRTEPPRYIVGEYAPSEDFRGAPFYTGLGID